MLCRRIIVWLVVSQSCSAFNLCPTSLNRGTCLSHSSSTITSSTSTSWYRQHSLSSTELSASKKRRRRRKDTSSSEPTQNANEGITTDSEQIPLKDIDELPDFDLDEELEIQQKESGMPTPSSVSATSVSSAPKQDPASFNANDPAVLDAMKATNMDKSSAGTLSTKDLLRSRNRELEQKFVVNELTQDLPTNLNDLRNRNSGMSQGTGEVKIGKKAARAAARKAAAIEAKESELQEGGLLSNVSFLQGEDGKPKSPIKLLEEGTWACIYILVAWEVYINSPFFERAAPLAPVVFETPDMFLI